MIPDRGAFQSASPRRGPGASQLVIGVLVIGIGVLFTLDNLGLADAATYVRYWPVALILVGLTKLSDARDGHGGLFGGTVITLLGLWLLVSATIEIRIDLRDLWPMLLVVFGGYLVWRGMTGPRRLGAPDDDTSISALAIMGGLNRRNNARRFRGGDLTAIMGGCEIDLRQAAIDGDAVIDVFALWGGIEIRVPEEWNVMVRVLPFMGGVEDKTRPPLAPSPHRLTVRGLVVMGGVEVKH